MSAFINLLVTFVCLHMNCVIVYGDEDGKSNLVFVIDRTESMRDDIDAVKNSSNAIFETIFSYDKSPIENTILVTFADPEDNSTAVIAKSPKEFKSALNSIALTNGDDCPEFSISGIKKGLQNSLPHSYIFVFTDAAAKDLDNIEEVKRMAREKECTVNFILTDICPEDPDNRYYHNIANVTSGQVFDLKKPDLEKIFNYVRHTIESRSITLFAGTFPRNTSHTIHVVPDSKCKNTTVSITSTHREANISNSDGEELYIVPIVELANILIFKLTDEDAVGSFNLSVYGEGIVNVLVTAKSDIFIRHGFSTSLPLDLTGTTINPKPGVQNYLIIKLFGDGVILNIAKLVNENYKTMMEMPLKLLDAKKQLYATSLLDTPKTSFRIAAKGIDTDSNNTPLIRFGDMIIEPDPSISPNIKIEGDTKVTVEYNDPLQLNCTVNAYPYPDIKWINKNEDIIMSTEVISVVKSPSEFIRILQIHHVTENTLYECSASNIKGSQTKTVEVLVKQKPHFTILEKPEDKKVEYGDKAILRCRVDAFPPAKISWKTYPKRHLIERVEEKILSDGSEITIESMKPVFVGVYVCLAENANDKELLKSIVTISGVEAPVIDKNMTTDIHIKEGESVTLKCSLLMGKPKPSIQWFRRHQNTRSFEILQGRNRTEITLKHENRYDTGFYICKAYNFMGTDTYERKLVVEYPPTIKKDVTSIVVKEGDQMNMTCEVDGVPVPDVLWYKNDLEISSDIHVDRYHSFKILEASLHDSGEYTCLAMNVRGATYKSVNVVVYKLDYIYPIYNKYSGILNNDVNIYCNIDGVPKPAYNWTFISNDHTAPQRTLTEKTQQLNLHMVQEHQQGRYVCEGSNAGGSLTIRYELEVQSPPKIQSELKSIYRAMEGDLPVNVQCKANGIPAPTISWIKDGRPLPLDRDWYDIMKDWLKIKHVSRSDTAGKYYCRAMNKVGNDTRVFEVIVDEYPYNISTGNTTVSVEEGKRATINCPITHEATDTVIWYKDIIKIAEGKIEPFRAEIADSGVYTCRVNRGSSSTVESANTVLLVSFKPTFINYSKKDYEFYYETGKMGFLNCEVTGYPMPTVSWLHNGETLMFSETVLSFIANPKSVGEYECRATNDYGSVNRRFKLKLSSPPEIQPELKRIYRAVEGDLPVKVQCRATGTPAPNITWIKDLSTLTSDSGWYNITEDWLIINVSRSATAGNFSCQAKNKVGTDTRMFELIVDEYPYDISTENTTVIVEKGQITTIHCSITHEATDTVIWYKDKRKIFEGKMEPFKAELADSGLYTCRVNHVSSSAVESANTELMVGFKPKFVNEKRPDREYAHNDFGYFDCVVTDSPNLTINWWHNGVPVANYAGQYLFKFEADSKNYGKYECKVSNTYGSINRTFQLLLSNCILKIDPNSKNQPLIVTPVNGWLMENTRDGLLTLPRDTLVKFSCAKSHFTTFAQASIIAKCKGGSHFIINAELYNIENITCNEEVKPSVENSKGGTCYGEDTKMVKIVFHDGREETEVYSICLDKHQYPIYGRQNIMNSLADNVPKNTKLWDGDTDKVDIIYSCAKQKKILDYKKRSSSACCFDRRQLVSSRDVFPGPAQRATYSIWNTVPHWSTCHSENWNEVETSVRELAKSTITNLIVYTGISGNTTASTRPRRRKYYLLLSSSYKQPIPAFIWKVIQNPAKNASLAIIQLNKHKIEDAQEEAKKYTDMDICDTIPWIRKSDWHNVSRGFTFCIDIDNFVKKFMLGRYVFAQGCNNVLYRVSSGTF